MGSDQGSSEGASGPGDPESGRPPDHGRNQRGSGGSSGPAASQAGRPPWQDLPPGRRHQLDLVADAREDLHRLKRREPKVWAEIQKLFDAIEKTPDLGYPLEDEWDGCYAVHCGRDRYRVIWEVMRRSKTTKVIRATRLSRS